MNQTAIETEIFSKTYEELGIVRFKKAEKGDCGWWICLTDMVAMYPATDGEPFNLEKWLNLTPQTMVALHRFLERKGEEVWGAYAIAVELARIPQQTDKFRGFPSG